MKSLLSSLLLSLCILVFAASPIYAGQALLNFENVYSPIGTQYSDWGVTTDGNDALYAQNAFFTNLPSPTIFLGAASTEAASLTFNVAGGFTGISLYYSYGDNAIATVKVYSGVNATGSVLATINLTRNAITAYDVWTQVSASHSTALSFQIAGPMDSIYVDDVRFTGAFKPRMDYSYAYATAVGGSSVTVNADVNPAGDATSVVFQYATNASFTGAMTSAPQNIGSGTAPVLVTQTVSGLARGTVYYFRAVATNSAGSTTSGYDGWQTLQTTATTQSATSVTANSAVLNGNVTPNELATTAHFQYATNASLTGALSTSAQSIGSGTTAVPVSATLSGLSPGVYYYRMVAANSAGTFNGAIASFAVNPGYTLNGTASGTFTDISGTGTQVIAGGNLDDVVSASINIGFTFPLFGTNHTSLFLNSNGLATFGGSTNSWSNIDFGVSSLSSNLDAIAVLWDDWMTTGGVYALTTGSEGQRVFTAQWSVRAVNGTGSDTALFQMQLFEASSDILIIAQDTSTDVTGSASGATNGGSATIGIRKAGAPGNGRFLMHSYNSATIPSGTKIRFSPLKPVVSGLATQSNASPPGSLTLMADLNPNNSTTTAQFEYGPTANLGSSAPISLSPANGGTVQAVSAVISGLPSGTNYFRVVATNGNGTTTTAVQTFVVPPPEIQVEQPASTLLVDGVSTVNYGTVTVGFPISRMFKIRNIGHVTLANLGISFTGPSASAFSVTANPATSLAPNAETTFAVTCSPTAGGVTNATMRLNRIAGDANPFDIALSATATMPQMTPIWSKLYGHAAGSEDYAQGVAMDAAGNVAVTGYSKVSGGFWDYYTAKYSGVNGSLLWEKRYNGPGSGDDAGQGITVDNEGNVIVTGYSLGTVGSWDYYTAKYAAGDGALLWERRYNGTGSSEDYGMVVKVDGSNNVLVSGASTGTGGNWDYYTAKYNSGGALIWSNRYNGTGNGRDEAQAMALDSSGNVLVTGSSQSSGNGYDYFTRKIRASAGALGSSVTLWGVQYNGSANQDDIATAIAVDSADNALVTGRSWNGSNWDYYTAKYAASNGALVWEKRYHHVGQDDAYAIAVDASGNAVVTGYSNNGSNNDYYTVKYAAADGAVLWSQRYNGSANGMDVAFAVAVDAADNSVVVTGTSSNGSNDDFYTVRYAGATGAPIAEARYNSPYNGEDWPRNLHRSLVLGPNGRIAVTGTARNGPSGDYDYATVVYGPPLFSEIAVEQPVGTEVTSGESVVSFGSFLSGLSATRSFKVKNSGTGNLTGLGISFSGTNAADFSVTASPVAPVTPNGETNFTVTFSPMTAGTKTATLFLVNNDPNENPFTIAVSGTALTAAQVFAASMVMSGLSGGDAAADATPYDDGVENLLKYGFNMNLSGPDAAVMATGGQGGLPLITAQPNGVNSLFRFEFVRRKNSGLIYTPQKSASLTDPLSWQVLTDTPTVTSIDANWERVVYEEPYNATITPRLFGRVKVSLP